MRKVALILVILVLIPLALVNCRGKGDSPIPGVGKKIGEKLDFDDTDDLVLTEKEVKAFIKAFPVFKETIEKEGEKLEDIGKGLFKTMKGGREALKSMKKLNKVLKPYGFTMETFMKSYAKIFGTFGYMMGMEAKKLAMDNVGAMKKMLDNPALSAEEKKEIEESIKELEKGDDTEEARVYKKNMRILEKYKKELEDIMN